MGTELVAAPSVKSPRNSLPSQLFDRLKQDRLAVDELFLGTTPPPVWMSSLNAQYPGVTHLLSYLVTPGHPPSPDTERPLPRHRHPAHEFRVPCE